MPPPRDSNGAPQKDCQPALRARRAMTDWPVAVSLVSPSSTTSASHAKTVWQWGRSAVTFETATRSGPGWGCTSPHRTSRARPRTLQRERAPRPDRNRCGEKRGGAGALPAPDSSRRRCRRRKPTRGRAGRRAPETGG